MNIFSPWPSWSGLSEWKIWFESSGEREYETLAGLILYYNEDIPEEGERISIEDISFEIVSVKSARIEEVRVKI